MNNSIQSKNKAIDLIGLLYLSGSPLMVAFSHMFLISVNLLNKVLGMLVYYTSIFILSLGRDF